MLKLHQILARGLIAVAAVPALSACGQKGMLYLPTEPAARGRATLPQTVVPGLRQAPGASTPPAAAPATTADPALQGATESPSTTVTPSTPARPVSTP